jgi:hypothetical protein
MHTGLKVRQLSVCKALPDRIQLRKENKTEARQPLLLIIKLIDSLKKIQLLNNSFFPINIPQIQI